MDVSNRNSSISLGHIWLLGAPFIFWASLMLTTPFVNGDQVFYRNFYESLAYAQLNEIIQLQLGTTGSGEPLFGAIMWFGAKMGVDKDIYVAIWNTILACSLIHLAAYYRSNIVFIFLLLTNFYVVVLFTSAERLKFSYIALALAAASSSPWRTVTLCFAAVLSHFQTLIALFGWAAGYATRIRFERLAQKINLFGAAFLGLVVTGLAIVFAIQFQSTISEKASAYMGSGGFLSLVNIAILLVASLICFPKKAEVTLMLVTCAFFAFIFGSNRINMIAFSIFIFICIKEGRTAHPAVTALMLYFSYRSIDYVRLILTHGDGFSTLFAGR